MAGRLAWLLTHVLHMRLCRNSLACFQLAPLLDLAFSPPLVFHATYYLLPCTHVPTNHAPSADDSLPPPPPMHMPKKSGDAVSSTLTRTQQVCTNTRSPPRFAAAAARAPRLLRAQHTPSSLLDA